jgi:hypothetical protein
MSDKKKEKKYCQGNFDLSNQDGGIITGVFIGVIFFTGVFIFYTIGITENIRKTAKNLFPGLNCNNNIKLVKTKIPDKSKFTSCTCYYGLYQ